MAFARRTGSKDRELEAINVILDALKDLDGETINRILDYVFGRLSIVRSSRVVGHSQGVSSVGSVPAVLLEQSGAAISRQPSVRDLKEEKRPKSSNQMAALVAYYLSEIDERHQDSITVSEIQKYFKQAGFALPKSISQTLPNAAAAGYLDSVGDGRYRLNPVGYNLIVHGLPRGKAEPTKSKPKKKK